MKEELIQIIKQAGKRVLEIYHTDFTTEYKKDESPVTLADLESEKILIKGLEKFGYGIVSEESTPTGSKEKFWVIDPLDGTKDFIQKTDEFCIMIGLVEDSKPILGVIYLPALDKLYYAKKGEGAYLIENNKETKIQVNSITDIKDLKMVISNNHFRQKDKDIALRLGITKFKGMGSVGVKCCSIAQGLADLCIYTTSKLGIWDCCAPQIIITESGGAVFDTLGKKPTYTTTQLSMPNGFIVSTNFKTNILKALPKKTGFVLWFTGLSGSGKSTISESVYKELKKRGLKTELLDGDEVRDNLTKDLTFSKEDRDENIRRMTFVCKLLSRNNVCVITAFISPYKRMRDYARNNTSNFIEVYVSTPIEDCEKRDVKGLYKKARSGVIENFTGISDPYEEPTNPEIKVNTLNCKVQDCTKEIIKYLEENNYI